jgi:hypothetical protein
MTFWQWLDNRWPTERGWVTIATFILAASLLKMAEVHHELWNVELFKTLLTLVIGTAIVNMILAFHFTANKSDEKKTENTKAAFDAITATANASGNEPAGSAAEAADETAGAAVQKADQIREDNQ